MNGHDNYYQTIQLDPYEPINDSIPVNHNPGTHQKINNNIVTRHQYRSFIYLTTQLEVADILVWFYNVCWRARESSIANNKASTRFRKTALPLILASILEGASYITEVIWPLIFYALLFHDFIKYWQSPDDQYGTTMADIVLGTANNQQGFSSTYGTDMANINLHWMVPTIVGISIAASAIVQAGYDYWLKNPSIEITNPYVNLRALRKAFFWGNPGYREAILRQIIVICDWNTSISIIERLRALWLLKEIASHYRPFSTYSTKAIYSRDQLQAEEQDSIYQNMIRTLDRAKQELRRSFLEKIVAKYLLWSLGESDHKIQNWFWLPFLLLSGPTIFYAKERLVTMWYRHGKQLDAYLNEKHQCLAKNKLFSYQPEMGNMQCGVCAGWDFIPYQDQDDPQKCLAGLLVSTHDIRILISRLKQLAHHVNFSEIDLSAQAWISWNLIEWHAFWDAIDDLGMLELDSLNLSQVNAVKISPNSDKMVRINQFLQKVKVKHIDLHNLALMVDALMILYPGACTIDGTLNLAANHIGNDPSGILSTLITHGKFKNINLSDNQLKNDDVNQIFQAIIKRANMTVPIYSIDISRNPLSDDAFPSIAESIAIGAMGEIKLAGISFSTNITTALATGLLQSNRLESLDISETELHDIHLPIIINQLPPTLKLLDISNNPFSDLGILNSSPGLLASSLRVLALRNVLLTQTSYKILANLTLSILDITDNSLNLPSIDLLSRGKIVDSLETLLAANTQLDDIGFALMLNNFINHHALLTSLDISNNNLSPECINTTRLLPHLPLNTLIMRDNQLTSAVTLPFIDMLPSTSLINLDITNTKSNGTVFQRVLTPRYQFLRSFNFNFNSLSDQEACEAATQLITPIPHQEMLGDACLRSDEARAIHQAQSQPSVSILEVSNVGLTDSGKRCLIRTWPKNPRLSKNLHLDLTEARGLSEIRINLPTAQCPSTPFSSVLVLGFIALMPTALLVLLLFRLKSCYQQHSNITANQYQMFRPPQSPARHHEASNSHHMTTVELTSSRTFPHFNFSE